MKKTLAVLAVVLMNSTVSFAWQKTFGVVLGDFSVKLQKGVIVSLVTQSDVAPTVAYFRQQKSILGIFHTIREADESNAGCFKSVKEKDGKLSELDYVVSISEDVARTLGAEKQYMKNSKLEVGLYEDPKDANYFVAMAILYDSRNAPVKVFHDKIGKTIPLLDSSKVYSQDFRKCE